MWQAESFPHSFEQIEIRRFHAMMLINRAGPGDREEARRLLSDALASYTRIRMLAISKSRSLSLDSAGSRKIRPQTH